MVFLIPVREDPMDPQPREIYNWRVVAVAIAAAWGSSMFGYDSAFIGGTMALPSFQNAWGLADASEAEHTALSANIVSTFQAGCFVGALLVYFTNDRLGRRPSLIGAGVIFNIGVILQLIGGGKVGLFYAGRALTGLGVGSSSVVIPQYIAECAPAAIRGALVGLFEIMLQISAVCGYWVNFGVNRNISPESQAQWRIPVGVQLVPGTFLILGMLWAIESPRHSVAKGLHEKAIKDLQWLRNLPADHPHIQMMISNIENQLEHEGVSSAGGRGNLRSVVRETFSGAVFPRLMIGIWIQLFQNFTGINAVNYFSPTVFKSIGFTGTSVGLLATGVYGVIKTVFSVISFLFLVDRFGRRPLLLGASVGCVFSMYYLAGYASLTHSFDGGAKKDGAAYSAIAMVYLFAMSYASGWNLSWIVCSELYPVHVRSFALTITTCAQWLGQFIVVYSMPYMMKSISWGAFLFFGSMTVIAFGFVYFCVPETKGVSLEDMDILFQETKGLAPNKRKQFDEIIALRNRERVAGKLDGEDAQHIENSDKTV
ncbi:MFS quinate transporter QutD [Dactylonectria estremocensis]|uniref:Quinate transporter n=1 Tax=Dactylonectria estremocensis TaxID=1079267 RepID=A0A9P9IIG8_9HYPO|nr:MFS quinate transporter QutD [Dactylonectria estremocensis]